MCMNSRDKAGIASGADAEGRLWTWRRCCGSATRAVRDFTELRRELEAYLS